MLVLRNFPPFQFKIFYYCNELMVLIENTCFFYVYFYFEILLLGLHQKNSALGS